tara:strand:+ start:29307 stop:29921 length:615 start_codon:yes stop_codon:yes gene_type:complete
MDINDFLLCKTPDSWLEAAASQLPVLLMDHANCEKKAASTALNLMYRYVEYPDLLQKLSRLAREELRHFEQVLDIMQERGLVYEQISSARYAGELRKGVSTYEPARLVDILIVSAIVEARSCERFSRLIDVLDDELASFYSSLLKSEARHFKVYLNFARSVADFDIDDRIQYFLELDRSLISSPDPEFRFHSGAPRAEPKSESE